VKPHLLDAMRVLYAANVPVGGIGTCGFPPCLLKGSDLPLRAMERERQNEGDVSGRLYVEECASCVLREDCLGLRREYIDLHGGRGIEPFDTPPPNLVT
jgi:hypothetical protein